MVAATFRQPNPLMIMYTAKTASSGSATDRTQSAMPSSNPTATHLRSDGPGRSHITSVMAKVSRNRNGTSDMIRCSSSISNPS